VRGFGRHFVHVHERSSPQQQKPFLLNRYNHVNVTFSLFCFDAYQMCVSFTHVTRTLRVNVWTNKEVVARAMDFANLDSEMVQMLRSCLCLHVAVQRRGKQIKCPCSKPNNKQVFRFMVHDCIYSLFYLPALPLRLRESRMTPELESGKDLSADSFKGEVVGVGLTTKNAGTSWTLYHCSSQRKHPCTEPLPFPASVRPDAARPRCSW
jgi:hypothetical protein